VVNHGERSSAGHPRRGVPSLAKRRKTNIPLEVEKTTQASAHHRSHRLQSDGPLFRIGQTVSLSLGSLGRGKFISGKIVKLLPLEGICYQYRVKCPDEAFQRVTNEHELVAERSVF
jgi:hypothetical protein